MIVFDTQLFFIPWVICFPLKRRTGIPEVADWWRRPSFKTWFFCSFCWRTQLFSAYALLPIADTPLLEEVQPPRYLREIYCSFSRKFRMYSINVSPGLLVSHIVMNILTSGGMYLNSVDWFHFHFVYYVTNEWYASAISFIPFQTFLRWEYWVVLFKF